MSPKIGELLFDHNYGLGMISNINPNNIIGYFYKVKFFHINQTHDFNDEGIKRMRKNYKEVIKWGLY